MTRGVSHIALIGAIMMTDDELRNLEREAARVHQVAPWLKIDVSRDDTGTVRAKALVEAQFDADPNDLSGSLIREIHRRLDEFDANVDG